MLVCLVVCEISEVLLFRSTPEFEIICAHWFCIDVIVIIWFQKLDFI